MVQMELMVEETILRVGNETTDLIELKQRSGHLATRRKK